MGKTDSLHGRRFGLKQSYFGDDTKGHDVKAFGDTTGKYAEWDASANTFKVAGTLQLNGTNISKTAAQINQNTLGFEAVVGATEAPGTAVINYGISTIGSTSGAKYYALAAPIAGQPKKLVCTAGSSENTCIVNAGEGVTFDGTNGVATFNAAGDSLDLVGLSATRWFVNVNNGSVALST